MRHPIVFCLVLLATACAPRITAQRPPLAPECAQPAADRQSAGAASTPVAAADVRIFADTTEVPRPYVLVGYLTAQAGPVLGSAGLHAALRRQAGALGANGVIFSGGADGLGSASYRCIPAVRYGTP